MAFDFFVFQETLNLTIGGLEVADVSPINAFLPSFSET